MQQHEAHAAACCNIHFLFLLCTGSNMVLDIITVYLKNYKQFLISFHKYSIYPVNLLLQQQVCSNMLQHRILTMSIPRNVIITSNNTHLPNLRVFYACSCNLLSMLQNNHYAAHMQLHAAATWFFHTRAILNCFEPQIWYNITILIHFHAYSRDQKKCMFFY